MNRFLIQACLDQGLSLWRQRLSPFLAPHTLGLDSPRACVMEQHDE